MITEERLKELIEQGKEIYVLVARESKDIYGKNYEVLNYKVKNLDDVPIAIINQYPYKDQSISNDNLFENKEQAEWARDFQRIERTEYLDLPSWEEINERLKKETYIDIPFCDPQSNKHSIWISPAQVCVCDYWDDGSYGGTDEEFNKENYIKACEMAKRLFLGKEEK